MKQEQSKEQLVERFTINFEALKTRNKSAGPTLLRLAALGLAGADADDAPEQLSAMAKVLKQQAKGGEPLRTGLRFTLAAMLYRRGLDPEQVAEATRATRKAFKEYQLKRSTYHAYIAAFLLVVQSQGRQPEADLLTRMAEIIAVWKEEHPWLTGQDDYPMAALHAIRGEQPQSLSHRVETIYQGLRRARFRRGDQLQLTSHLLAVGSLGGEDAVARFTSIAAALRQQKVRVGTSRYDEVALLTLLPGEVETLVRDVLEINNRIQAAHGGLFTGVCKEMALSMAVGIEMARFASELGLSGTTDASTLAIAQTAIEAQQAAVACMIATAGVAAATASASASVGG